MDGWRQYPAPKIWSTRQGQIAATITAREGGFTQRHGYVLEVSRISEPTDPDDDRRITFSGAYKTRAEAELIAEVVLKTLYGLDLTLAKRFER